MSLKLCLLAAALASCSFAYTQQPPATKKVPKVFNEHGGQRVDDYYWLSNPSDSLVIHHLKAENAYVDAYMKNGAGLQKAIYDELVSRIPGRDQSLPVKRNGYWYYSRFEEGKQYPYYLRRADREGAAEEVILDVPGMAKPYKIFLVRGNTVSPDNKRLLYGIDTNGSRRVVAHLRDLGGDGRYETIANTSGNYAWSNDNRSFYYVVNDHTVRANRIMRHLVGTDPSKDEEIYTEKDSTYRVFISRSKSNRYLFLVSGSTNTTEIRYIDLDAATPVVHLVQPRTPGVEYRINHYEGDRFHIMTNKNALNYKVVTAPVDQPGMAQWKDFIPHDEKALIQNLEVLKDYYVLQVKEAGLPQIRIFDRKAGKWSKVAFGQDAYVANMYMATDAYESDSIRYSFNSLISPSSEYMYSLRNGEKKLLKQQKAGDFDPSRYTTRRIWAKAKDGTRVPVSLAYRKDLFRGDGSNPLHLYSYGSYGSSTEPYFNSSEVSLMDRGFVYAIAHIRGGQEMGRAWYENGRVLSKKNTFTDFIDVAETLIRERYTAADRLFASGGSAGGMLMGAVVNMRPDLFRGVVAYVPWMDVITDMFNTDLPLTTLEYEEWGDPNKKEHYEYMLSWSPMDNVKKARYPAIFATGGLHDTQVPYFSPAKWVAKVREHNTGDNPVLFQVNMGAGHGGESGRFERQKLSALVQSFMLGQIGWNEETKTFNFKKKTF